MEEKQEVVELPIHPHPLTPFNISGPYCGICFYKPNPSAGTDGYRCGACTNQQFHKECAESPMEIRHPYHPPHPLTLRPLSHGRDEGSEKCGYCREKLRGGWIYHCSLCHFFMHSFCAKEQPVLEVEHPKSHGHSLSLLPKPRPFTCDACGLASDPPSFPWACLQCGFMVHRECIDLPRLIRISRHRHRLSYVSSPPPSHEPLSCGVCRRVVHSDYGAYSCINGCSYILHPKCATREDVWDGVDLYGVPEEPEDFEAPFEVIDDNVIRHFSHEHHLKLSEYDGTVFDGSEHCQACALPARILLGDVYSCTQRDCGFVLHETCANLPRKIWHMVHPHRLKLESIPTDAMCPICDQRNCSGFIYRCCKEGCIFKVDVNCASVTEPFIHNVHPHPLFSASVSTRGHACSGCKRWDDYCQMMECIECDFFMCFRCITLPPTIRYKHDRHPLVLQGGENDTRDTRWWCEDRHPLVLQGGGNDTKDTRWWCEDRHPLVLWGGEEDTNDTRWWCKDMDLRVLPAIEEDTKDTRWWCEICERSMNPEEMYYTCDSCCVTVHVNCILGEDTHMMPGRHSDSMLGNFRIAANVSCCRPLCYRCENRCRFPTVIRQNNHHFCSSICLTNFYESRW